METPIIAQFAAQSTEWSLVWGALGTIVGMLGMYLVLRFAARGRLRDARKEADRSIADASSEADVIRKTAEVTAREEFVKGQERLRKDASESRGELKVQEKRIAKREDNLEAKLDTLETKERVLEVLDQMLDSDGVSVAFGDEVDEPGLRQCALVAARYGDGEAPLGMLGVIGPTRMDYGRVISLVDYLSQVMTGRLSS